MRAKRSKVCVSVRKRKIEPGRESEKVHASREGTAAASKKSFFRFYWANTLQRPVGVGGAQTDEQDHTVTIQNEAQLACLACVHFATSAISAAMCPANSPVPDLFPPPPTTSSYSLRTASMSCARCSAIPSTRQSTAARSTRPACVLTVRCSRLSWQRKVERYNPHLVRPHTVGCLLYLLTVLFLFFLSSVLAPCLRNRSSLPLYPRRV